MNKQAELKTLQITMDHLNSFCLDDENINEENEMEAKVKKVENEKAVIAQIATGAIPYVKYGAAVVLGGAAVKVKQAYTARKMLRAATEAADFGLSSGLSSTGSDESPMPSPDGIGEFVKKC